MIVGPVGYLMAEKYSIVYYMEYTTSLFSQMDIWVLPVWDHYGKSEHFLGLGIFASVHDLWQLLFHTHPWPSPHLSSPWGTCLVTVD